MNQVYRETPGVTVISNKLMIRTPAIAEIKTSKIRNKQKNTS